MNSNNTECSPYPKFGKLSAIKLLDKNDGRPIWLFQCDCGVFLSRKICQIKQTAKNNIPQCLQCVIESRRANGKKKRTHGVSVDNPRLYDVHRQMMKRCYHEPCKDYHNYGGRGISVCDEWHNVLDFVEWAFSTGYHQGLTLERVDVNSGYSPDNCTWIPNEQQALNTRKIKRITYKGETKTIVEWAEILGMSRYTLKTRISLGWSIEDAFTIKPKRGQNHTARAAK